MGGSFLILQSTSPLVILLGRRERRGAREWSVLRFWWAVAAGSWALTHVLQLQPELWNLGNGSQPNYNDWLPVRWHFSDGDCRVWRIRREGGGSLLIGLPLPFFAWEQPEIEIWLVGEKRDVSWFGEAELVESQRQVMLLWWRIVAFSEVANSRKMCAVHQKTHTLCQLEILSHQEIENFRYTQICQLLSSTCWHSGAFSLQNGK